MRIRELRPADAAAAAAIEADLFVDESPWSRDVFLTELAHPYTFYVGAFVEDSDEVVLAGYAGVARLGPREDPEFEVHTIAVARQFQSHGIGRALMDQLVHAADMYDAQMFLEVRTDNEPAIALYKSYGFAEVGVRKGYYPSTGADAYTMMRHSVSEVSVGSKESEQ
ncbi:ribosomal protein S18-alanine N-acetyltransferase [uncultured Corynebacterium sp.]|uniref:ribosomal protein S18-alanine N-acetyltransferase n=1 Tax=uncultured Corynebacterium sp. TaxID=159447 RepID=UPI002633B6D4|nr:ribosomal protein S18-alanine N-acetyltransferase [uncultured Corynebacterium sp.]